MMSRYRKVGFPPENPWDERLSRVACTALQPVETLHENDWFAVRNRGGYYTVEYHLRHILVLPAIEGKSIVLVRVKRPVVNDAPLELPAGCAENGESPEEAAARELSEETGIAVADLTRFVPMPPLSISPNRFPRLAFVFRIDVTQQEYDERQPHDNEIREVTCVSLAEAASMLTSGTIYISAPVAVIGTYLVSRSSWAPPAT
jgi:8-oxo-dGTP pyrophosphatase MutT (NUDIX family)